MSTNSAKPCAFYNSPSGCKNGDKCQFSHDNSHNKEICKFFNSPSGCKYGDKCDRKKYFFNVFFL